MSKNYGLTAEECARVEAFARALFADNKGVEKTQKVEKAQKVQKTQKVQESQRSQQLQQPVTQVSLLMGDGEAKEALRENKTEDSQIIKKIIEIAGSRKAALEMVKSLCD